MNDAGGASALLLRVDELLRIANDELGRAAAALESGDHDRVIEHLSRRDPLLDETSEAIARLSVLRDPPHDPVHPSWSLAAESAWSRIATELMVGQSQAAELTRRLFEARRDVITELARLDAGGYPYSQTPSGNRLDVQG